MRNLATSLLVWLNFRDKPSGKNLLADCYCQECGTLDFDKLKRNGDIAHRELKQYIEDNRHIFAETEGTDNV